MGCSMSFLTIIKRRFFTRRNRQERSSPVFPRRITDEVFDYIDAPEPLISVPYRAQPYQPSPAIDYMNWTHYNEVRRIFKQSPHPYPLPPNHPTLHLDDPVDPEPVVRRTLENRLEYKVEPQLSTKPPVKTPNPEPAVRRTLTNRVKPQQSTKPPVDVVHKSTRYVIPIYSDDSDSDDSVAELIMSSGMSDPVDIPVAGRKRKNYTFRV